MISVLTGFRLFLNKKLLNLMAVFLTGITLLSTVFLLVYIKNIGELVKACRPLEASEGAYFFRSYGYGRDNSFLYDLEDVQSIGTVIDRSLKYKGQSIEAVWATPDIAEHIKVPLIKGKWFTDAPQTEGIINMVAEERLGFKVGEIVQFTNPASNQTVAVRITGILPDDLTYRFNGYMSPPSAELFISKDMYRFDAGRMIGLNQNPEDINLDSSSNVMIFYNQGISAEAKERNLRQMQQRGSAQEISVILQNTKDLYYQHLYSFMPVICTVLLLAVLAVASSVMITVKGNEKHLKILYFYGASKGQLFASVITFSAIILAAAVALMLLLSMAVIRLFEGVMTLYSGFILKPTLIFSAAYFAVNAAAAGYRIKKFLEEA